MRGDEKTSPKKIGYMGRMGIIATKMKYVVEERWRPKPPYIPLSVQVLQTIL
jgi:hypothetical protein